MIIDTLPDTLAELLERAIADLKIVENDNRYVVDMNNWHDPIKDKCSVCMAGACLSQLGFPIDKEVILDCDVDRPTYRKLQAINCLRMGNIEAAYRCVYIAEAPPSLVKDMPMSGYRHREQFYSDIEKVLEYLKKEGI